ncbi:MAG: hypothetical protein WBV85_08980 [Solirubrobacteraceae bacterium]
MPTDATASEPATANTTASISQSIPRSGTSAATTTTGPAITASVANIDNGKNARKRCGTAAAREPEESGIPEDSLSSASSLSRKLSALDRVSSSTAMG